MGVNSTPSVSTTLHICNILQQSFRQSNAHRQQLSDKQEIDVGSSKWETELTNMHSAYAMIDGCRLLQQILNVLFHQHCAFWNTCHLRRHTRWQVEYDLLLEVVV